MIDLNLIQETTTYAGQQTTSSLDGTISIEEGRGRMVIRDAMTKNELVVIDRFGSQFKNAAGQTTSEINEFGTSYYDEQGRLISGMTKDGTSYYDEQGRVLNKIDKEGQHVMNQNGEEVVLIHDKGITIKEGDTQRQRARFGTATDNGRTGAWISDPGTDIRNEGI